MKKIFNKAFIYLILGLSAGVYYREFTKFNNFDGFTQLGVLHTHILVLGLVMMLIVLLFVKVFEINKDSKFKRSLAIYEGGLHLTILMLITRGTLQVLGTELSKGLNAAISGISGVGHIILGVGFVMLMLVIKRSIPEEN